MTFLTVLWERAKWVVLGVLAVGAVILGFVFRGMFDPPKGKDDRYKLPTPPKPLQDAMARADEKALAAKAAAKAVSAEQKARVEAIMQTEDGADRRAKLAEWLKSQ